MNSEMSSLTIHEKRGAAALAEMRDEWQELFRATTAAPFLSWEWATAWQQTFGRSLEPRLLCARDQNGALIGLLSLGAETCSVAGLPLRKLSLLGAGDGAADYVEVLARPGREQQCARALLEHLAADRSFDLLELDGLATDSLCLPMLTESFGNHGDFRLQLQPRYLCPQMTIHGTADELLSSGRLKRLVRKLEKMPGFEHRLVTAPAEADEAFARFIRLHEARWAASGEAGAISAQTMKQFQREVVRRMAQAGWLRIEELWIEGDCRATLYGFETGRRYYLYLSGYQPEWAKLSPGFVIIGLAISRALERGVREIDFLRGAEAYKAAWANAARSTLAVRVTARTAAARLSVARDHLAVAARALLPDAATLWLSRLRRRFSAKGAAVKTPEKKRAKETVAALPLTNEG
ncbi:MAG TPA: GNAT family N-acetyltransferase [Blastocatellia bacterium]|nr:GNAT family N-acetyltransferase [Blastocatellia bacterium]